jgi:hypothetical protein
MGNFVQQFAQALAWPAPTFRYQDTWSGLQRETWLRNFNRITQSRSPLVCSDFSVSGLVSRINVHKNHCELEASLLLSRWRTSCSDNRKCFRALISVLHRCCSCPDGAPIMAISLCTMSEMFPSSDFSTLHRCCSCPDGAPIMAVSLCTMDCFRA